MYEIKRNMYSYRYNIVLSGHCFGDLRGRIAHSCHCFNDFGHGISDLRHRIGHSCHCFNDLSHEIADLGCGFTDSGV